MANRDLTIRIDGDSGGFEKAVKSAQASASVFERELKKLDAVEAKRHATMTKTGTVAMAAGAAMAAGLAIATRSAVQWESAWAGVTKTVDGSAAQMGALEGELREMARSLPASHVEIAAVAEAAGQLGVKRDDIAGFTKTMIDLGVSTNLSADEAATSIAQFSNVMGTMEREGSKGVERLGATLVALGNQGASTERDIMDMAQRLAGVGKVIGASESDVLALANAMSSMGIEAENGSGVMSRALVKVYSAVKSGGEQLQGFADVAGMSAQAFAQAFENDPIRATDALVQGLSRVEASGGNVIETLSDLGIEGTRDVQVLLSLKGAGDLLTDSLDLGNRAWSENRALVDEANKRYETTEAKLKVARNSLNDFAIDIGNVVLPALGGLADGVSDVGRFLADLPGPVQTSLTILGGLGAAIGLVGGAALVTVPKLAAMRTAMETLGVSARRTDLVMKGLSATMKGGAIAGAVIGIALAVDQLVKALADSGPGVGALTDDLVTFAQEGHAAGELAEMVGENFEGLAGKIARANKTKYIDWTFGGPQAIETARNELKALDETFAGLVSSGNTEVVTAALAQAGLSAKETADAFPKYTEALRSAEAQSKLAEQPIKGVGGAMFATKEEAEAAQKAVEDFAKVVASFVDPMGAYNDVLDAAQERARERGEAEAQDQNKTVDAKIKAVQREYEARIDAARKTEGITDKAIQDLEDQRDATVESLDVQKKSWEDYADTVTVKVADYLAELEKQVAAQEEWEGNMLALTGRVSQGTIDELAAMGREGAPLVAELVDASDEELARLEGLFERRSKGATEAFAVTMRDAKPVLEAVARQNGAAVAAAVADELARGETTVRDVMFRYGLAITGGIVTPVGIANLRLLEMQANIRNLNALKIGGEWRIAEDGRGGFAEGGYTGDGGKYQPAGVVHAGEYVAPQEAVRHYGRRFFDDIRAMRFPRQGYADGGFVSASRALPVSTVREVAGGSRTVDNSVQVIVQGNVTRQSALDIVHEMRDEQFRRGRT